MKPQTHNYRIEQDPVLEQRPVYNKHIYIYIYMYTNTYIHTYIHVYTYVYHIYILCIVRVYFFIQNAVI